MWEKRREKKRFPLPKIKNIFVEKRREIEGRRTERSPSQKEVEKITVH